MRLCLRSRLSLLAALFAAGFASPGRAATRYVADPAFPNLWLSGPVTQTMSFLPLQDGGALAADAAPLILGSGGAPASVVRVDAAGGPVDDRFAGDSGAQLEGVHGPVWVQLRNGNILAALLPVSGSTGTPALVQFSLAGATVPNSTLNFSAAPAQTVSVTGLWLLADGSVMVAGQFSGVGGHSTPNLAHLTADGQVDSGYAASVALSAPFDVGTDGAAVGVSPAPSTPGQTVVAAPPTFTRLDPRGAVTDSWTAPAFGAGPVAMEASGNVLVAVNQSATTIVGVAQPVTLVLTTLPTVPASDYTPALYRFKRGVAGSTLVYGPTGSTVTISASSNPISEIHPLADGSILLTGGPGALYSTQPNGLVHLFANGSVDTQFSPPGLNGDIVQRLRPAPGGWMVDTENVGVAISHRLREFSADFATGSAFNPDLRSSAPIQSAAALPDSSVLFAGTFENPARAVQFYVRVRGDGSVDYTHVPLTPEAAASRIAAIGPDGSIYLAGTQQTTAVVTVETDEPIVTPITVTPIVPPSGPQPVATGPLGAAELERYASDGTWDSAFGRPVLAGAQTTLQSVAIDAQDRILLCGSFGPYPVAQRLLPAGAPDPAFNTFIPNTPSGGFATGLPLADQSGYILLGPAGSVLTVDNQGTPTGLDFQINGAAGFCSAGGSAYLTGNFFSILGTSSPGVQRLLANGQPDLSWHSGMTGNLSGVQAQGLADGRLLVANQQGGYVVLTAGGALDRNETLAGYTSATATADGAIFAVTPGPSIHRLIPQPLPTVGVQANAATYHAGDSVALAATGGPAAAGSYVWLFNGSPLAGITGPELDLSAVPAAETGWYTVGVPTAQGLVYAAYWLNVVPVGSRISNASARGYVGTGALAQAVGFFVQGTSAEPALFRLVGSSLSAFGLAEPAAGLKSSFYANGLQAFGIPPFTYPRYTGTEPIANTTLLAGAFPFTPASDEAQIQLTLGSSTRYSVSRSASQAGIGLTEIYLPETSSSGTGRSLVNFSCLSDTEMGDRALIVGFVIEGTAPLSVLVRGLGPALQPFGVVSALTAPLLQVYAGSSLLGSNDHWQNQPNSAQIAAAAAAAHAFALAPGSADGALLLSLPPGVYTAVLTPQGLPGQGMIELYESSPQN